MTNAETLRDAIRFSVEEEIGRMTPEKFLGELILRRVVEHDKAEKYWNEQIELKGKTMKEMNVKKGQVWLYSRHYGRQSECKPRKVLDVGEGNGNYNYAKLRGVKEWVPFSKGDLGETSAFVSLLKDVKEGGGWKVGHLWGVVMLMVLLSTNSRVQEYVEQALNVWLGK